ncbi:decarboxylating 6-phosphogluconate dehydrogenase [Candidatus Micrarchaeota archaeon]|nr:decarboxylating 6-phosphogluconate dehydrogenase [Candidatus Micrarchaeota archaeon]
MEIGFVGLGRMGRNVVLNLLEKKVRVVAHNRSPEKVREIAKAGAVPAFSPSELCAKLKSPRVIWLMVTAGAPVDEMIAELLPHLRKGDLLIDGGNSFYKDSIGRHDSLRSGGIDFLDVGTSGGLGGARHGACLTIGGEETVFKKAELLFKLVACKDGYAHVGGAGAGHYVKIIHNGMEYALLQAYGEGFEALAQSPYKLDLPKVAKVWQHGSVIRSWLLELAQSALEKDPKLERLEGEVGGGETGRWAIGQAWEAGAPFSSVANAYSARLRSRQKDSFSGKVIAAVRNGFGGHEVTRREGRK